MTELTSEELESQHVEVLPARDEMLLAFVVGTVAHTVASTCSVTTTSVLGKQIIVAVC